MAKTILEQRSVPEKTELTEQDLALLNYKLLPEYKRSLLQISSIFILSIPILPFFPARYTRETLGATMTYGKALLVAAILIAILISVLYYFGLYLLKQDLKNGYKTVIRTLVVRKYWRTKSKFILEVDKRPKNLKTEIKLDKAEFYNWYKNDIIEISYLERSGTILSYKKINV